MKIKICGLTSHVCIDYVNEALPDYIGFVFAESKRRISFDKAAELKKRLNPVITAVGVFVNADMSNIIRLYDNSVIDMAQLHGSESETYIEELKKTCDISVIKALSVGRVIPKNADFLLFDNGNTGGTGQTFDWSLIPDCNKPYFLAGGINLSNIGKAVKTLAYCLDLSSGAETDGIKDREKIIKLVGAVKEQRKGGHDI